MCSKPRKWPWLWQVSRGAARKMPGLQVAGSGEISGAPQDDRRISNVPLAAARGRQCVGSCWATRGGHRQGLENAIFTWDRPRGRWALCVLAWTRPWPDSRRLDWHETGRVLRELRSTAQRHYCISMFMCLNFTRYCSFFAFSSGDSPSSSSMVK